MVFTWAQMRGRVLPHAAASQERAAVQLPASGKLLAVPAVGRALQAALPAATLQGGLKELTAAQAPGEGHATPEGGHPFCGSGYNCPAKTPGDAVHLPE